MEVKPMSEDIEKMLVEWSRRYQVAKGTPPLVWPVTKSENQLRKDRFGSNEVAGDHSTFGGLPLWEADDAATIRERSLAWRETITEDLLKEREERRMIEKLLEDDIVNGLESGRFSAEARLRRMREENESGQW